MKPLEMQVRAVEAEAIQQERQDEEHARHHTLLADQPPKPSASPERCSGSVSHSVGSASVDTPT